MPVLLSNANPFRGRIVDSEKLPNDPSGFAVELEESLAEWRAEGTLVVWLELPVRHASLVPVAVAAGFIYHHATEEQLVLTLALVPDAHIPPYATHYIGAGGVVLDADRNLLVIQERHHTRPHLKLPGGAAHPGEHIADAVIREVREETGIETEYVSLVCFRHWHGYRHGKSDIYFVSLLRPLTSAIALDPHEIAECRWMPVDDYLAHPDTHAFNRRIVRAAIDAESGAGALVTESIEGYGTPESHEIYMPARSR